MLLGAAAYREDAYARWGGGGEEAVTVVNPKPAATSWSLASQSRAVWTISGRSSSPGHTPIRRSSPEEGPAIQRWPRRSATSM